MIAAPIHWNQTPVRGCAVCTFGRLADGSKCRGAQDAEICINPAVAGQRRQVAVLQARANAGPCGPEAVQQALAGELV